MLLITVIILVSAPLVQAASFVCSPGAFITKFSLFNGSLIDSVTMDCSDGLKSPKFGGNGGAAVPGPVTRLPGFTVIRKWKDSQYMRYLEFNGALYGGNGRTFQSMTFNANYTSPVPFAGVILRVGNAAPLYPNATILQDFYPIFSPSSIVCPNGTLVTRIVTWTTPTSMTGVRLICSDSSVRDAFDSPANGTEHTSPVYPEGVFKIWSTSTNDTTTAITADSGVAGPQFTLKQDTKNGCPMVGAVVQKSMFLDTESTFAFTPLFACVASILPGSSFSLYENPIQTQTTFKELEISSLTDPERATILPSDISPATEITTNSRVVSVHVSDNDSGDDMPLSIGDDKALTTSKVKNAAAGTDSRIQGTSLYAMVGVFAVAIVCGLVLFYLCSRDKSHQVPTKKLDTEDFSAVTTAYSNTEATTTNHTAAGYSTAGVTSTFLVTIHGLFVPGYLQLQYGIDLRQGRMIARGGFGRVFLGEFLKTSEKEGGQTIIIKELILKSEKITEKEAETFFHEVAVMSFLGEHKNIAKIIGYTEAPHTMVMKYYVDGSLDHWIKTKKTIKTKTLLVAFSIDIAKGLEYMHSNGIIHADVKPHNVLLDRESTGALFCVLTDFGITQVFHSKNLIVQAFVPVNINGASIFYAAPEALNKVAGEGHVAANQLPFFDIFSFSVLLHNLVSRRLDYILEPKTSPIWNDVSF